MDTDESKLHIYIDESSTLGIKQKEPYFIVCALILKESEKSPIKNAVKRIFRHIITTRHIEELHANEMSFQEKEFSHNELKNQSFFINYLVAHKLSIHKNLFRKKNVCFNYFVYLTVKNVLIETALKNIHITIDTRSVKVTSEKSLEEYLNTQLAEGGVYDKNVYVSYGDSRNFKHLQAVDLFANALYAKYNFNKNHFYNKISDKIRHNEKFPQWHFDKQ